MAVPAVMAYRKMLMDIGNQLSERDFENIKFLCKDFIPRGRLEDIEDASFLWDALEERSKLSSSDTIFLKCLLTNGTGGRTDLLKILTTYETWHLAHSEGSNTSMGDAFPVHFDRLQTHNFTGPCYNNLKREIDFVVKTIGRDWRNLLRELGVSEPDIDYLCDTHSRDMREKIRQGLLLWQKDSQGRACKANLVAALKQCKRNDLVHTMDSDNY